MYLKLFVDSTFQSLVENMDRVRQGRIAIYHLPEWSQAELSELLQRRLAAYGPGEFARHDL